MPWAHLCRAPILAQGPSIPRDHPFLELIHPKGLWYGCPSMLRPIYLQRPQRLIYAQGSSLRGPIPAQGPSILRAQGSIHAKGLSISTAHPCPRPIYLEGPWGPIHAPGLSMARAQTHPCLGPIKSEGSRGPIPASAHPSRGPTVAHPCLGPISAQGPSIPRVHGGHLYPWLNHAEGPSLPIDHPSRESTGTYPWRGPISA